MLRQDSTPCEEAGDVALTYGVPQVPPETARVAQAVMLQISSDPVL